jgi:hypothetical protein
MVSLRNAVMAVALGTGVMGCGFSQSNIAHYSIWHCDECDDFPMPAYGPGYSMMPGTYTGSAPRDSVEANPPATTTPDSGSVAPPQRPMSPTTPPATPTLPVAPPGGPAQGADTRPAAAGAMGLAGTLGNRGERDLPQLPATTPNDHAAPVANP